MDNPNPLIVITGKTASGKDTVMAKLLARFPAFKRVITTTSRPPRNGEQNGVDYYFILPDEFKQKINDGDFIEYVGYGGNMYGTQKTQITKNLDQSLIWRIDPYRAGQIRQLIKSSFESPVSDDLLKKVLVIYLTVSDDVVLQRLRERKINEEEIQKRMEEDRRFWNELKGNYDFVVENVPGKLDETVEKIVNILRSRFS